MSGMKINSIGKGNETKQHLPTIPNKSQKNSIQTITKKVKNHGTQS
jgi:hypothetical protein